MNYTYVNDLPNQTPAENMRQGIRLSKQLLLPNALRANPHFVSLLESTDEVLDNAEHLVFGLQNIRNPWVTNPALEAKILAEEIIDESDWTEYDNPITTSQGKQVGFLSPFKSPRVLRNVPRFWHNRAKGVDLINFCFGLGIEVFQLWTNDYTVFSPEQETEDWYLTTHIKLRIKKGSISREHLSLLVYQVVPYTTVIHEIEEY